MTERSKWPIADRAADMQRCQTPARGSAERVAGWVKDYQAKQAEKNKA